MKDASEIARAFVAEQSGGEWGEKLEFADALRLSGVIRAAQAEAYAEGIARAAKFVAKRRDDYHNEKGSYDASTGAWEYPGTGDEYIGELEEIEEAIRALASEKEGA